MILQSVRDRGQLILRSFILSSYPIRLQIVRELDQLI